MAGFKTHVSVSGAVGIVYGAAGYACGLPPTTAAVGAGICTLGGMIPDLDGDTGVAVREIVPLVAAAVPILMLDIFKAWGFDRETTFLAIMGLYLAIRFGIGIPFKKLTRHRGMWHSIPAAINVGLICVIVCSYQELAPRMFKASAITLGFLSHLILDELYSMEWFRAKSSAGTAMKFYSRKRLWPNVLTYGITAVLLTGICLKDSSLRGDFQAWRSGELKINLKPDWNRFLMTKASAEKSPISSESRKVDNSKPEETETSGATDF